MTAPIAIPLEDRFGPATEAINAWRGRCLMLFARAEASVSEALMMKAGDPGKPMLPLLVGQRFAALEKRLAEGKKVDEVAALAALRTFASHDDLRAFLCHGDSRILIDRAGRWQAVFTIIAPKRGGGIDRRFLLIDSDEAGAIANELNRDQHRLTASIARITALAQTGGHTTPVALRIGGTSG